MQVAETADMAEQLSQALGAPGMYLWVSFFLLAEHLHLRMQIVIEEYSAGKLGNLLSSV